MLVSRVTICHAPRVGVGIACKTGYVTRVSISLDLGLRPSANLHPVVWLFVQAPSELGSLAIADAKSLVSAVPTAACRSWIARTPALEAWWESGSRFVAPADWPEGVREAWRPAGTPLPVEVANALPARANDRCCSTDGAKLLVAYACGVPLATMADVLDTPAQHILRGIQTGAMHLARSPRFILWATNVDFARSSWAAILPKPLSDRLRAHDALVLNPLTAAEEDVAYLVASPLFMRAAQSGTLPRRLGSRQMREPSLVRPPRHNSMEASE
jgi:hypothetical protein